VIFSAFFIGYLGLGIFFESSNDQSQTGIKRVSAKVFNKKEALLVTFFSSLTPSCSGNDFLERVLLCTHTLFSLLVRPGSGLRVVL